MKNLARSAPALALAGACLLVSPLGTSSVSAEDFTGFYAGVNAGYAFERDGSGRHGSTTTPDTTAADTASGLPPSALTASRSSAMRDGRASRTDRTSPR